MRLGLFVAFSLFVSSFLLTAPAFCSGGDDSNVVKAPLDLPAGKIASSDKDEDSPESIIFYGAEVEGDSFFWCIPAYGFCGDTTPFELIKQEVTTSLNQLSPRSWFSIVGYNSATYVWSYVGLRATPGNKASAIAWMTMLVPVESHCLLDAALTTLQISHATHGQQKSLMIVGARAPSCGGNAGEAYASTCLTSITAANLENSTINTIYVTSPFYSGEAAFYQNLAAMNQGQFEQINY